VLTSVLVAGATAILGVVTYLAAARIQMDAIDNALVAALTDPRIRVLESRLRPSPADSYVAIAIGQVDATGTSVSPLRSAGTAADAVEFPVLTAADIARAQSGPATVSGSPDYRVLVRQPRIKRNPFLAATPLTQMQDVQSRLAAGILISSAAVSLMGGAIAWFMVRRYFRPMEDMVDSAQAIARGDTDRRVPSAPAGTEMGELSGALNTMIGSLTRSLADVEATERRLRRFVSDASHEIRTPLTVISGYVELLRRDDAQSSELDSRALARIETESRRLDRLVTTMLLLEQLDAGASSAHRDFDLGVLVLEYFTDIAVLGAERAVDMDVPTTMITGDADSWRQLLANLAQNITRYTPAGSPVAIRLQRTPDAVILTVDDAGPGIPADQRATALERFHRLDPSRSRSTGGFGLGLSVVRSVVEDSRGSLELLDGPVGGLRVQISIPDDTSATGVDSLRRGP
jgi:two-component system OmpR family sensor kinase